MKSAQGNAASAVKNAVRTMRIGWFLFVVLACTSCERRSHFVFWKDSDHFCAGKTFSLLVESEEGVQAVQFMEHGSGYRASSRSDSWLVQWKVDEWKEGQTNYPTSVIYLGHHEVVQQRAKPLPVRESGVDVASFRANGETDFVLREAERLEVFKVAEQARGQLTGTVETGGRERVVFNRSRQHFFAWMPFPAIYASSNLTVVIENVNGELLFIAYSDSERLAILNGESKVLVELQSGGTRFFNFGSNFHWDYRNQRTFVSDSKIDLHQAQREVVVMEYDYQLGQTKRFVLNAGEMKIPKSKP